MQNSAKSSFSRKCISCVEQGRQPLHPCLNSQAEMCPAYWGSDTLLLFHRKISLLCSIHVCLILPQDRATRTEHQTSPAPELELDGPASKHLQTAEVWLGFLHFHQGDFYALSPRQSVPCFTIPAARNYPQISSLILPSCKYQPIVNNSYRELNNAFSLLQCLFFVITSPSQNKNDAPHSPLFNAKESKLLHPFIEGVIC